MKKYVLALVVAVLSMGMAVAQPKEKKDPSERADKMIEQMEKQITLTADKKSELKTILITSYKEVHEAKKADDKEKIRTIKTERENKIKTLLGEEDFKKYRQVMAERKKHKKEMHQKNHKR